MLNVISDLIFKNRYGVVRKITVKTNLATGITHYVITTVIGDKYAGVLSKKQDAVLARWYRKDKLKLDDWLNVEDYRYEKYVKTQKKWGWRDIFSFRQFLK